MLPHTYLVGSVSFFASYISYTMTSSSFPRGIAVFLGLFHLGIAVWTSVILGNAAAPTELLLAYVGCECAFGYLGFLAYLLQAIFNASSCSKRILETLGTGMFIWNTVMLFGVLDGIPQSPTNAFAYFVYVNFFINVAVIALSLVACAGACCCLTAFLVKEDAEDAHRAAEVRATIATIATTKAALDATVELTSVSVREA